jgi:broad-specificity NMP kinase
MGKSVFITGPAGSGKSTMCRYLQQMGYRAYDIERVEGLFEAVDRATGKASTRHERTEIEHVINHDWICDKAKLHELMRNNSKDDIVFYCGSASNVDELLPLFDRVFLLEVSDSHLEKRLSKRQFGEFGHSAEVRALLFSWRVEWEKGLKAGGAIGIDAEQSLRETTEEILRLAV